MPFTIDTDIIENDEVRLTEDSNGDLALEHIPSGQTLTVDDNANIGDINQQIGGLSADGTEADLSVLHAEESYNTDNPVTGRLKWDGAEWVVSGRDGVLARDGSASTALNNALDTFPSEIGKTAASGGVLSLQEGNIEVDAPIDLGYKQALRGEHIDSTNIDLADGVDANVVECTVDGSSEDDVYFSGLFDLTINGNKSNNTAGHGFYVSRSNGGEANDNHLMRVFVDSCPEDGMHFDYSWGLNLNNWLSERNVGHGLYLDGNQASTSCGFSAYNGGDGVHALASDSIYYDINSRSNDGDGFYVETSFGMEFIGCVSTNNGGHGYDVRAGSNSLTGCIARENGQDGTGMGIRVFDDNVLVSNCHSFDGQSTPTQDYGLVIGASDVRVSNSAFYDNATEDIYLSSAATDCTLHNVDYGTIDDSGTRTIVNGRSTNGGDPNTTGQWNGHADRAYKEGAIVWDTTTSPQTPYIASPDGSWYNL